MNTANENAWNTCPILTRNTEEAARKMKLRRAYMIPENIKRDRTLNFPASQLNPRNAGRFAHRGNSEGDPQIRGFAADRSHDLRQEGIDGGVKNEQAGDAEEKGHQAVIAYAEILWKAGQSAGQRLPLFYGETGVSLGKEMSRKRNQTAKTALR